MSGRIQITIEGSLMVKIGESSLTVSDVSLQVPDLEALAKLFAELQVLDKKLGEQVRKSTETTTTTSIPSEKMEESKGE